MAAPYLPLVSVGTWLSESISFALNFDTALTLLTLKCETHSHWRYPAWVIPHQEESAQGRANFIGQMVALGHAKHF